MVLITIVTGVFVNQLTSLGGLTLQKIPRNPPPWPAPRPQPPRLQLWSPPPPPSAADAAGWPRGRGRRRCAARRPAGRRLQRLGVVHQNLGFLSNENEGHPTNTGSPRPPGSPTSKQYDILITRGWMKTLAIRSDFDFKFSGFRVLL